MKIVIRKENGEEFLLKDFLEDYASAKDPVAKETLDAVLSKLKSSIYEEINALWHRFYQHEAGHIPPVKTVAQLQEVLERLGLDKEYIVEKQRLYI